MDPFATLGVPRRFDLDLKAVEKTHRDLSRALHPDKYVGAGASERKESLSKAVEVNEAWRAVRDPVTRAEALFSLAGIPVGETNEPKASSAFLMDMMDQREALAAAKESKDEAAVSRLAAEIERRKEGVEQSLAEGFSAAGGDREKLASVVTKLGELRFYKRFLEEVSAIEEESLDAF